jgi:CDP-glycerol glycerophosphotransferase
MPPSVPAHAPARILSFVLAVHGEQAYVEECASSLLNGAGDDVELVAVDDASPDHAPSVLDALAERDARVRVIHRPERAGRGAARELGLAEASGAYVWFGETTGVVAPGGLAAVLAALAEHSPDALLVQRREPHGPVTLDERPRLADAAPRAWDKVLRTEHVRGLGCGFGRAGHDELSVTWPALLAADRIAAAAGPAYEHRRPGNAVRDRLTTGSPADVFDRYEAVFAFLAANPGIARERARLALPAMTRHALSLYPRVPEAERADHFARVAALWRAHGRGDEPAPAGRLDALRRRMVERGDHRSYALLEASRARKRALGRRRAAAARARARAAGRAREARLKAGYRVARGRAIDPELAVFAAYWYRGYACNPRAIHERARELVPSLRGVWVARPDAVMPAGVEHVAPRTPEYYDLLARARYFVNNVNFPDHLVKRPGTVHVMTHHGTPLKRMGLDLRDTPVAGVRMDFDALLRRCRRWDYSISQNAFSTLVWERVYPTSYESLEVGYPRNDALALATAGDVARIRAELGIEPGRRVVMYAPTHREYRSGYVPLLDVERLAAALGEDHVVLARVHYFYGSDPSLRALHRAGRLLDVAAHPSVEELCIAADVLITDYSSLMFDYAVLDRPIVIHAPDWDVYRAMRGTYFDLFAEPPGTVCTTQDEVAEALRSGAAWDDDATSARAAFRERFCSLDDGRAAERVVRRVWLDQREPAPHPVPSAA